MGLTSSKGPKEVKVTGEDIGVVRISESAFENLKDLVEAKGNDNNNQVTKKEEQPQKPQVNENDIAAAKRLNEYEQLLIQNFDSASKDVEKLLRDRYKTIPVCLNLQNSVAECYKLNQKYPLKCLDISEQYKKCVENERLNRFKSTGA